MKVEAYFNHGRWVCDCPKCGKLGSTLAEPNKALAHYSAVNGEYICPNCYPGMVIIHKRTVTGGLVFNEDMQAISRARAKANDEIYEVIFPTNKKEIEAIVSLRRLDYQNWQPGETIEFLKKENETIGAK
jgi:phage terminase large subunit GpA-like protein